MKGRTGSTLSRTKYVKCFRVETSCYRLVLWLNFIVTVELLYDQAEGDFVQCQTKMRAFTSRIEIDWNRIVHQNASWSLVFSTTRPRKKQISAPDASQPSSIYERWQVAELNHLKTSDIFSLPRISTKDFNFLVWKGRLTDRLESTIALSVLNGPKSFFVASRLIAEVNEFLKNTGHTGQRLNQRVSLWYGWELRWIELGCVRRPTSQEMKENIRRVEKAVFSSTYFMHVR